MSEVLDKPAAALTRPAPAARAVLLHRKRLEAERDALRSGCPELALKSASGDAAARAELRAIPDKLAGLQFEIDQNHAAHEIAHQRDAAAETAWRTGLQMLPTEQLLSGLNRDECPGACQSGIPGGCVLAGGAPHAGANCWHPCRFGSHHQFSIDDAGRRVFPHRDHPQAAKVFSAAVDKLGMKGKFAP
jgi:hypothetical protein